MCALLALVKAAGMVAGLLLWPLRLLRRLGCVAGWHRWSGVVRPTSRRDLRAALKGRPFTGRTGNTCLYCKAYRWEGVRRIGRPTP